VRARDVRQGERYLTSDFALGIDAERVERRIDVSDDVFER